MAGPRIEQVEGTSQSSLERAEAVVSGAREQRKVRLGQRLVVTAAGAALVFLAACGGSSEAPKRVPIQPPVAAAPAEAIPQATAAPQVEVKSIPEAQEPIVEIPYFELESNNLPPPIKYTGEESIREKGWRNLRKGPDGEMYYPAAVELPLELQEKLFKAIEPLNNLLPQAERVSRIEIYQEDPKLAELRIHGVPDRLAKRIQIFMAPDIKIPVREIEIVAFHEMVHILIPSAFLHNYEVKDAEAAKLVLSDLQFLEEQAEEAWNQSQLVNSSGRRYKTPGWPEKVDSLFNLVDESSNMGGSIGHPYDTAGELIASTMTVFRFFPESFISFANNLTPDDRRFMKSLGKHVIEFIKTQAEDPNAGKMFHPRLLEFLYSE